MVKVLKNSVVVIVYKIMVVILFGFYNFEKINYKDYYICKI